MGMYTELFLDCHINAKLLSDIEKDIITYLFDYDNNDIDTPTIFPKHYFFRCSRWHMVGRGGSAYFEDDVPKSLTKKGMIGILFHALILRIMIMKLNCSYIGLNHS